MKKIAVFGATGQTGRLICQLLLDQDQDIQILACARTLEKLEKLQASLDSSGTRLTTHSIDLHNTAAVDSILGQVDLAVGATSQWQDGPALAARALEASIHYCGINLSNAEKWEQLRNMHDNSVERGISIVDDCGTHPGLPGAMIRWVNLPATQAASSICSGRALVWLRKPSPTSSLKSRMQTLPSSPMVTGKKVTAIPASSILVPARGLKPVRPC